MRVVSKRLIGGLVLLVLLVVSFYMFFMRIDFLMVEDTKQQLITMANNDAASIKTMFKNNINFLNGIAAELVNSNEPLGTVHSDFLHILVHNMGYARIAVDLPNGSSYISDGSMLTVSETNYFQMIMNNKTGFANIYQTIIDSMPCVSIVVPIMRDGVAVGLLRGIYESSSLVASIDVNTFNGQGYFNLIDANGNFIFGSANKDNQVNKNSHYENDFFEMLRKVNFIKDYSLDTIKRDLAEDKCNFTAYSFNDKEYYAYYAPIEIGDLYIMSVAPAEYILIKKNNIDSAVIILLCFLSVLFCGLVGYLYLQKAKLRMATEHERDYLNSILNNIPLPVFITNDEKTMKFINEAALKLFNKNRCDVIDKPCSACDTSICNTSECAINKMIQTGSDRTFLEDNTGNYLVSTAYLKGNKAANSGFIEVIQDVSSIVEMQKILEEKTLELETISENLAGGVMIASIDKGFPIIRCNQGYCDLVGYTEDYFVNKLALDAVAPEDRETIEAEINKQFKLEGFVYLEHHLLKRDGEKIWVSLHGKKTQLHGKEVGIFMILDISNRKETERDLKISEERYRIATQNTEDIIIDYNIQTKLMIHTPKVTEIYGAAEYVENAPESLIELGIIDKETAEEFLELFEKMRKGEPKATCILKTHAIDGRILWNRISFSTIFDNEHNPIRAIGILQDITREMEAKQQYEREAQYRKIIGRDAELYYEADLTHKYFITGQERIIATYGNEVVNDYDSIIRLLIEYMVYQPDHELVWSSISWESVMKAYFMGKDKVVFEYRRSTGLGEFSWVECTLYIFEDEGTKDIKTLCYIKDVNEMKIRELALQQKAERDLLTGLYNKVTAENLIKQQLSVRSDGESAFVIIDLDNFKDINDTLGHAFGDAVLSEVSQRLADLFKKDEIVGRLGGDEFVVFLPKLDGPMYVAEQANKICEMFHSVYTGKGNNYKVSGSVGVSISTANSDTFEELYHKGDIALYYSKKHGKDTFSIYNENMMEIKSSVDTKKIDGNAGKLFSENMIEYVVRILYEATDRVTVTNAILELVSKHFNYSHAYFFEYSKDDDSWCNTCEWCADGIESWRKVQQTIPNGILIDLISKFNGDGIFIASKIEDVPKQLRPLIKRYGIQSMIQFALKHHGEMAAIVGFEDCKQERIPTDEECLTLHMISMLLGTCLKNCS